VQGKCLIGLVRASARVNGWPRRKRIAGNK